MVADNHREWKYCYYYCLFIEISSVEYIKLSYIVSETLTKVIYFNKKDLINVNQNSIYGMFNYGQVILSKVNHGKVNHGKSYWPVIMTMFNLS